MGGGLRLRAFVTGPADLAPPCVGLSSTPATACSYKLRCPEDKGLLCILSPIHKIKEAPEEPSRALPLSKDPQMPRGQWLRNQEQEITHRFLSFFRHSFLLWALVASRWVPALSPRCIPEAPPQPHQWLFPGVQSSWPCINSMFEIPSGVHCGG